MKSNKPWLLIWTLLAASVFAADGDTVVEMRVEGNARVGPRQLLDVFRTKEGMTLDSAVLEEDIRTAYARYGVRVEVRTESVAGGVRVRLLVDEETLISRVETRGVEAARGEELLAQVSLGGVRSLPESQVRDRAKQLAELMRTEGRYFSSVDVSVEPRDDELVAVLTIEEGNKVAVDDIEFTGTDLDSGRLRQVMKTEESTLVIFKHWLQRDVLERDLVELERFIRGEGYRDATVALGELEFDDDREWVDVNIEVEQGERYHVEGIEFQGNERFDDAALRGELELDVGSPLRVADLERDVRSLLDLYGADGYVRTQVEPAVRYAESGTGVRVTYLIDEGPPKTVRDVVIRGNTGTLDEVVRRQVTLDPGDSASTKELRRTMDRLRSLSYFMDTNGRSLVDARFRETPDPLKEDLFIDVEETQFGRFFFTAGAATGIGFFAGVQLQKANFDIADGPSSWNPITVISEFWRNEAFHGGGQRLDISVLPGSRVTNIQVSFLEPYLSGPEEYPWSLEVGLYARTEQIFSDFEQNRYGVSTTFGKQIDDHLGAGVLMRLEGVDIDDVDDDAPDDVKDVEGTNFVPTIGGYVRRTALSPLLNPDEGYDVGARYELLFADAAGQRLVLDGSWYRPLMEDDRRRKHVLAVRGAFGLAGGFGDELPFFERFTAGGVFGDFPIRGFEYRRIGPEDSGVHLGGEAAYAASAEYRYPIYSTYDPIFDEEIEWLRGVVFIDLASTEDNVGEALSRPRMSVGAGLRVKLPMLGPVPVAIDLGLPVISESDDETEVLSIRISTRI